MVASLLNTAAQADVLSRDPALRDELLQQTQLYACRNKQIEGKTGLKSLGRMQKDRLAEKKKYASALKDLEAILVPKRYGYTVVEANAKHFKARATGKDDMAGDVWEIDEKDEPINTANVCKK